MLSGKQAVHPTMIKVHATVLQLLLATNKKKNWKKSFGPKCREEQEELRCLWVIHFTRLPGETAAVICIAHTHCVSALAVAKRQHLIRQQPDTLSVLGLKTGKRAWSSIVLLYVLWKTLTYTHAHTLSSMTGCALMQSELAYAFGVLYADVNMETVFKFCFREHSRSLFGFID